MVPGALGPLFQTASDAERDEHQAQSMEPNSTPAIHLPAPNKDQVRLNWGLSSAYLGLLLAGGRYAGASIGLCD